MTSTLNTSYLVSIDRAGSAAIAEAGSVAGPAANGRTIYEIRNCPANVSAGDVTALSRGLDLPSGIHVVDYDRLAARQSGSCCGGCCG